MRSRWDPLLALEFLTVIRLRPWSEAPVEALARAQAFYPLVGLVLGGVILLADIALEPVLPAGPRAALLLTLGIVLTRALHLDGLADSVDGLLGGRTAERRLEIMRDPRVGSFGATALIMVLLVQWSCIAALTGDVRRPGLVVYPMLGRFAMVVATAAVPYARAVGLGARYHEVARGVPIVIASVTALAITVLLFGVCGFVPLAGACLVALAIAWWSWRAVGGLTGDGYGAACVLAESGALLCLLAGSESGLVTRGGW